MTQPSHADRLFTRFLVLAVRVLHWWTGAMSMARDGILAHDREWRAMACPPAHTHRWPWNDGGHSTCACGVIAPWLRMTYPPPDIGSDVPGGGAV